MTDKARTELIAALEKATGPDRELDAHLSLIANPGHTMRWDGWIIRADGTPVQHIDYWSKPFTASIDAAMTLVPEGFAWTLSTHGLKAPFKYWCSVGFPDEEAASYQWACSSPAIALCIASLKARASLTKDSSNEA